MVPQFSVLIGRVSTEDGGRIFETLRALRTQRDNISYEVVIVDRLGNGLAVEIERSFPEVRLERCAPGTALPQMRTRALELARGEYVIVTEDHCVPTDSWLAGFAAALRSRPRAGAVAGPVVNGVDDRALDWATFLCEYAAFVPPVASGVAHSLTGMNVAYRREALAAIDPAQFTRGFWETTVHPLIASGGWELIQDDRIVIRHSKRFSFALFAAQRFAYSRYFGGIRYLRPAVLRRFVAAMACVLLPVLSSFRLLQLARIKPAVAQHALRAAPLLLVFYVIAAVGEAVGYLFGPGNSLARIE